MDYKKAYTQLFNAITTAINQIDQSKVWAQPIEDGLKTLKTAQQQTEEMYMDAE